MSAWQNVKTLTNQLSSRKSASMQVFHVGLNPAALT